MFERRRDVKKIVLQSLSITAIVVMLSGLSYAAELTIGLIPEQNVFSQFKRYKPLGEYIEKKTGIKIKFTVLSKYGKIIDRFYSDKMDGAFWGSFTGAMAIQRLEVQPLARPVNIDGTSSYRGYIIVHKHNMINNVSDMNKKVIAFVNKATTAGYLFPIAYFREHGIKDINTYFSEYYFTGSHDAAIYSVLDKKADIGCVKNTVFDSLARKDPRIKEDLVILAQSPDVPSNTLAVKRELAYGVKESLKSTLLEMDKDPEGRKILERFGAVRFIETGESDYAPVFKIAEKAGINIKSYKYAVE
jgi:phosphonate transport system substrate-binding protein